MLKKLLIIIVLGLFSFEVFGVDTDSTPTVAEVETLISEASAGDIITLKGNISISIKDFWRPYYDQIK
jgi:hypothetical protein